MEQSGWRGKQAFSQELPEDDGRSELRQRVHEIVQKHSGHEERAAALRALMVAKAKPDSGSDKAASAQTISVVETEPRVAYAPRLTALPNELIEQITLYLAAQDFIAFRSAGRALRNGSAHAFVKKFIAWRTIRLEWASLGKFTSILNDEHFGPFVKSITIVIEEEEEDPRASYRLVQRPSGPGHPWRTASGSQRNRNRDQAFLAMLDRIFGRCPVLDTLELRGDFDVRAVPRHHTISAFEVGMVFTALSSAGTKIKTLRIGVGHKTRMRGFTDRSDRLRRVIEQERNGLKRCFASLTRIELYCCDIVHGMTFYAPPGKCSFTNTLLEMTPNVETLVISLDTQDSEGVLRSFKASLPKLRLVVLHLQFLTINCKKAALRGFMHRAGKGVERLHIYGGDRLVGDEEFLKQFWGLKELCIFPTRSERHEGSALSVAAAAATS